MSNRNSTRDRRVCFDANKWVDAQGRTMLTCYLCQQPLDPAREKWEAEHTIRRILSEDDSPANLKPVHERCHKPKTATDIREHRKGVRTRDKHYGIKKKTGGFRKMPAGYKWDWAKRRAVKIDESS